jgi:hypothetical protein
MKVRPFLGLILLAIAGACSATSTGTNAGNDGGASAPDSGQAASDCTSTSTNQGRAALPTGACPSGATCTFQMASTCSATEGGGAYEGTNYWSCGCNQDGTWGCVITGGGLGLVPCDAGPDAHWTPEDAGGTGDACVGAKCPRDAGGE